MADEDPYKGFTRDELMEAFRIAREDGMHVHKTYAQFQAQQEKAKAGKTEDKPEGKSEVKTEEDTAGKPPPEKPEGEKQEKPKRKSLWWGDRDVA